MGTANFHNKNAGRIYACETENEFDTEDLIENLRFAFRSAAADSRQKAIARFEEALDSWETDGLRSYSGRVIAWVVTPVKSYRDFDVSLSADIIVRNGYYAGVNLDYELRTQIDGNDADDGGLDRALDNAGLPEKRWKPCRRLAEKWLANHIDDFSEAIEKVFAEHSIPLRLVATASNGEAFYEKA